MMTLRPLGPSVIFTAFASFEIPRFMASRASWSNAICLADISNSSCECLVLVRVFGGFVLADHAHHVAFVHQQDFAVGGAILEFVAGPRREQHLVADLQLHLGAGAVRLHLAGTDGQHGTALGFVLGGVGKEDTADGLLLGGFAANNNAVADRFEAHDGSRESERRKSSLPACPMQVPCPADACVRSA